MLLTVRSHVDETVPSNQEYQIYFMKGSNYSTYIYKITNLLNGKVYIGQSIRDIQQRFIRHINDSLNNKLDTHFARAIRKYGEDNFIIELIDTADSQDELNQKEQYWIRYYDSVRSGYNETDAIYKCGGNTYRSKTKGELRCISNKIRASKLGSRNPNSRKVKCRSELTGEELVFDTVEECQDYFGEKHHRFITTRVNHQTRSLYLTEWNIAYLDEPYDDLSEYVHKKGKEILVTDLISGEQTEYTSIRMTSRELNIPRHLIGKELRDNNGHIVIGDYQIDILD